MRLATSLGAEDDNGAELFRRRTRPVGGTQAVPRGRQQPPRVGSALRGASVRLAQRVHSPFLCVPFCRGVEQAACLHRCRQMGGPAAAELPPLDSAVAARYSVGSVLGKGAYGKGGERAAPCAPALATEDISSFQQSQRRRAPRALFLPGARVPTPPVGTVACAHRANWAAQ